jgi:glutamyl-tRNA reductase
MPLLAIGLNHQTAPVALREQVAFGPQQLPEALASLLNEPGISEAALLSTCNRTEIYCSVAPGAEQRPAQWLARHHQLMPDRLNSYLYQRQDGEAVRHLLRVATGLDSLVLGEPQVLGQVKDAYHLARAAGGLKAPMERLFQHAFAVAKRVRTDTRIGAHPVSVAFAGVRLAQRVFTELDRATVLLIGAGDTIELAARHLVDHRVQRLLVANRTLSHAQTLASRFGGFALPLEEIERHLAEADIVISATASLEPVLSRAAVGRALKARRHRPMLLLDLAVPRDIEPSAGDFDDVYLYTVDDLDQVVEDGMRSRRQAADEAQVIIDLQVEHYLAWWRASDRHDTLRQVRHRAEREREAVLVRAREMLEQGRSPQAALEFLASTLTNKLLHTPSTNLRSAAMRGDLDLLRAAERLFDTGDTSAPDTEVRNEHEPEHPSQAGRAD